MWGIGKCVCVCVKHTPHLWHAGHRHNLDSIIRNGLLAGGTDVKKGRRQHCYFSIADPRNVRGRPQLESMSGVTTTPYGMAESADVVYMVNVRRANELGIRFYQTRSLAVLCEHNVPPECIIAVLTRDNNVLYKNDDLYDATLGDQPAYLTVGHALERTKL